jgi:hypothetical protein
MSLISQVAPDEDSRVADVVHRLQTRFPSLDPSLVATVVGDAHRELDHASVRDFVPILVEKQARDVLQQLTT